MRSIDVDDINILEVQAFDHEGNVFSTVEGIKFQWRIEENPQALRIIPIKEARFKTSQKKLDMERKRQMSDIALLKGLKTGISIVSVQLIEDEYRDVEKSHIKLSVIEPFTLDPNYPVYILPNSEFLFGILRIKIDSKYTRVSLPSNEFVFFSDNEENGIILSSGLFKSKHNLVSVDIKAQDTAITTNIAQNRVHIVAPDQLEVELYDITEKIQTIGLNEYANIIYNSEGKKEIEGLRKLMLDLHDNSWILVEDRYYLASMYLFDGSKHKIQLTENLNFELNLNSEFIEFYDANNLMKTDKQTSNLYIFRARKVIQRIPAVGKLSDVSNTDDEVYPFDFERLTVERGIQITSQVKIHHPTPEIRLPYLGYHKLRDKDIEKQLWQLPSSGGTGAYKWQSANEKVTLVKNSKHIKNIGELRGYHLGETTIIVSDALNPFNTASITVHVSKVGSLTWLESKIEAEKEGSQDFIHLIAYDETGRKFTNCSSLIYNLSMRKEEESIVKLKTDHLSWNKTKLFLKENIELVQLRSRFDDHIDAMYKSDLPSNYEFDEEMQLHNNFGVCGSDKFETKSEGLARVRAKLPINYDSSKYSKEVEAENVQIASYETPYSVSPDYSKMFDDLRYPKEPVQHSKLFRNYFSRDVFKISYGSSLYWIFNGGTNYWADDIYGLEHSIKNNDYGLSTKCLSDNLPPLANRITYKFTCDNNNLQDMKEFEVSSIMQNKLTRSLLRPQRNVASLKVHCVIPKSVDLWWAQNDKLQKSMYKNMPEFVLENNEKTFYLRNNQSKYMKALVFDQDKQLIFNTTSLVINFSADHSTKLDYDQTLRNDKVVANFKKESGIVYAKVDIPKDIFGNKIYDVSNQKKIKLIEKVKINPQFQTKYLHEDNIAEFFIVDGSNNFRVQSNSSEIATLNHLTDINTINMSPESEGVVEITVEDLGVEDLETSSAELLVSDIFRIILVGGGLIEKGSETDLKIEVYDSQNKKFDQDQLKYMDIKAEIEKIGSSRREGLEIARTNDDTFKVKGLQSANYRVTVTACKKNGIKDRVMSNYVRIEVFDVVKLAPESILLFPGGRWTIQVQGGPQGGSRGSVYREYEVEDDHICEIDEYGEVHGKHVGETWLSLNLFYKSNNQRSQLASRRTKIKVALVTSIEIPMMNERSVFVNSLTRLNVKLKYHNQTFLHAIGPLSFDWSTSSSHVYSLSLPSRKDSKGGGSSTNLVQLKSDIWDGEKKINEEFSTNFNYSSIVGIANKNGDAQVSVKMAIEYPKEYKNEKNYFHNSVRIKVSDKLTMEVPEFIEFPTKEPHIYVLPPLSKNKIVTNKDANVKLAYSIQTGIHYDKSLDCESDGDDVILTVKEHNRDLLDESPILKIHDDGYIETLDKYGKATVVIEENQSMENQVVMLNIMVNQIYSLSIEKPYTALNLPMGSQTKLKVTYQEENARSFADMIEGVDLFIENSHPHIVQASLNYRYNSTLELNALGIGEANIKVFTKDNIFDVIRVRVLSSVLPHSPVYLHLGGSVQFIFEEKESSPNAVWKTDDVSVLSVDQAYGKIEGKSEGEAQVIYNGNVNLISLVNVKKVDRIELDPKTKPEFFTNARSNQHYKEEHHLLLNLFLEDGLSEVFPETIIKGRPLIKNNIQVSCETVNTNFAVVFSKIINNRYACILRPNPDSSPDGKIPNTIKVLVRATSQYSVSYKTEETFEIPFVSFFKINHQSKSINFYADERFKSLDVVSNTVFNVDIEGNSDLVNYKIDEKSYENHYEIQFSVPSSVSEEFKDLKVRVSNSLTDSSETFYLSYYSKVRSAYSHSTTSTDTNAPIVPDTKGAVAGEIGSQIVQYIILIILFAGAIIGLMYYCCASRNDAYIFDDSSFISSDSKKNNRYGNSTNKPNKGNSMRSYSRYHMR